MPLPSPDAPQPAGPAPVTSPAAGKPVRTASRRSKASGSRPKTLLARMVRAGVVPAGTTLVATHGGEEFRVTVRSDGYVQHFAGVADSSPDAAMTRVVGRPSRKGMEFWSMDTANSGRISLNALRKKAENEGLTL